MKVAYVESGAHAVLSVMDENHIPRVGDFVRIDSYQDNSMLYQVTHVEWVQQKDQGVTTHVEVVVEHRP